MNTRSTAIYWEDERVDDAVLGQISSWGYSECVNVFPGTEPSAAEATHRLLVPSVRNQDLFVGAMSEVSRWVDEHSNAFVLNGINLLDVARYALAFDLVLIFQRWSVVEELVLKTNIRQLIWVCDPAVEWPSRIQWRFARQAAARLGLNVRFLAKPNPSRGLPPKWWNRVRSTLFPLKEVWLTHGEATQLSQGGVLVSEFFPNSAKVLLPVVRLLREHHGVATQWVSARKEVAKAIGAADGTAVLADALNSSDRLRVSRALLEQPWKHPLSRFRLASESAGRRQNGFTRLAIRRALAQRLAEAAYWTELYGRSMRKMRPDVLVSTSYTSIPGRAAALVANHHAIPTVLIQHGHIPRPEPYWHFCHRHTLLWGERDRVLAGRLPQRDVTVCAVGAAHFDEFSRRVLEYSVGLRAQLTVRVAYLASRTGGIVASEHAARRMLRGVLAAVKCLPSAELIVRPHPSDKTGVLEEELRGVREARFDGHKSSQDLILDSDVVIVTASTTGYEACIARKPLIEFNLTGIDQMIDFAAEGVALRAHSEQAMKDALLSVVLNEQTRLDLARAQEQWVNSALRGSDGRASHRIAEIISELARPNRRVSPRVES